MPDPLDYFNPRAPEAPTPAERLAAAIPIEFDTMITHSEDHPAVRAIEAELRRHGIPFYRAEGGALARRGVELHVRAADKGRAAPLAAMIFARRLRLDKASPRVLPPRDTTSDGTHFPE